MATVDSQQGSWLPYDGSINRDCSQGFCSIYCPQWCYILFSPPPPLALAGAEDDSGTTISPLVISIIAILASALLLVSYYTFVSKSFASLSFSPRPSRYEEHAGAGAANSAASVRHQGWHVRPSNGLDEALINKITVVRYKTEEDIVEGTDCSVCLGEFKEEDRLRLLPKCSHAFHLQCIDTWLKSHANCPLCRANIVAESDAREEAIMLVEDAERSGEDEQEEEDQETDAMEIEEEDAGQVRRCLSMGSSAAYRSIADVLQMSMEEEYMVAKNCGLVGEGETWRRSEAEQSSQDGRNRGLNCVRNTVRMKRSVSSGRFSFGGKGRGRASLLPV